MPDEPDAQVEEQVEQTPARDEHAAHKSRMDRRVAEAEKGRQAAEQRVHEVQTNYDMLVEQLKVYKDLPEDVQEAVAEIAKGKQSLSQQRAAVNEIAKTTLAKAFAKDLGIDAEHFMSFDSPQAMEAAYNLLLAQRPAPAEEPAPPPKEAQPKEEEQTVRRGASGFDQSGSGGIFGKSVSDMSSEEFEQELARQKGIAQRRAIRR